MDVFLHFLHLLAAAVWVGGQLFLALVLGPTLRKTLGPRERMPLSLAVAHRFKKVSHGALGVLVLSGLWRVRYVFFSSFGAFLETTYGRFFMAKMVLFAAMIVLGVLHDKKWGPELAVQADRPESPAFQDALRRMMFWARVNIAVTCAVVLCAAALRHSSF